MAFVIPGLLTVAGDVVTTESVSTLTGTYDFTGATVTLPSVYVRTTGTYLDPAWITTLNATKLVGNLVYPGGPFLLANSNSLRYPNGVLLASDSGQLFYGSGDALTDQNEQILYSSGVVALANDGSVHGVGTALTFTSLQYIPSGAPVSPNQGQTYFDSTSHHLFVWNGTAWKQCDN